jgi:hypothetical protein
MSLFLARFGVARAAGVGRGRHLRSCSGRGAAAGGLPPLPDLEFAIYEKARPDKAAAALAAVLLTLAQGPSRTAI